MKVVCSKAVEVPFGTLTRGEVFRLNPHDGHFYMKGLDGSSPGGYRAVRLSDGQVMPHSWVDNSSMVVPCEAEVHVEEVTP